MAPVLQPDVAENFTLRPYEARVYLWDEEIER
jgi:hypothetical protein